MVIPRVKKLVLATQVPSPSNARISGTTQSGHAKPNDMDDCQSLLQAHRRLQASYHLLQESHLHLEDQVNTMVDSLEMFAHIVTELRDCWVWTADDTVHASPTSMQFPFEQLHQQATNEDIARPSLIFTMVTKPDVLNSPSSSTPSLSQQGTESDIDVSDALPLPPLTEGSPLG